MEPVVFEGTLSLDLGDVHRSVSSAVLGGGLSWARTWLNLQVPPHYARTDPEAHLRERCGGLRPPVVGMLTAAPVAEFIEGQCGCAYAVATVGAHHAIAAAGHRPRLVPRAGTINVIVVLDTALTDAGLVGATQTAVEAKAQALADARVPARNAEGFATGTATDSICVVCLPGGTMPFAGPATAHGADLAHAVYAAVLVGVRRERERTSAATAKGAVQ
jgi:adenosylcobinamide amidohydrolase